MNSVPLKYYLALSVFYGLGMLSMYVFTISTRITTTHFIKSIRPTGNSSRIVTENPMKTYRFPLTISEKISDILTNHINATNVSSLSQSLKNSGFTPARTVIFYNKPNDLNDSKGIGPSLIFPKKFPKLYKPKKGIGFHDTCAILGNAGILLGSRCGKEIDAHDFVMRSNMAPTKGFEDDVGVKTSLTTLNFEKAKQIGRCLTTAKYKCNKYAKDLMNDFNKTVIWFSKFGVVSSKYYTTFTKTVIDYKFGSEVAYPAFGMPRKVGRFWNISSASSGLVLYTIAGSICKKISMYGFYPFYERPNGQPLPHHYYEKIDFNYSRRHSMPTEYKLFLKLNQTGILRLVTDQCLQD